MAQIQSLVHTLAPVWGRPWEILADHGAGAHVWDTDGVCYLDCTSGIGVTSTGHCHPRVVEAVRAQAGKIVHAQANILLHEPMARLVEGLREMLPSSLDTFFFANSGAEAVEASIKLARQATGRTNVIAFEGSFHGRTIGTMSLTSSRATVRAGYQPLMSGVFFAPYAYCLRCPKATVAKSGFDRDCCCDWPLAQLRLLLLSQSAPSETAAIIVEPVLGEGGYIVPSVSFMRGLRQICDEHGIILIHDEIQTGFGRTGRFLASEHFGVVPDIVVLAKGMASGYPISAIAASRALMDKWPKGAHGGTYGGNAVCCAAAVATLDVIRDEGLVENAARRGAHLMERLRELQQQRPVMGDVRGLGLMVAVEFIDPSTGEPDGAFAAAVQQACYEQRLLLLTCGTRGHVIRWIPPLMIPADELDRALGIFAAAMDSTSTS